MMYSNIIMHGWCTKWPLSLISACIYYISESVGVANTYTHIHPFYADYQDWMLDIVASYAYLQHCHTAYTVSFNRMWRQLYCSHVTPASSWWLQLWTYSPLCWQSKRDASLPVHCRLSSRMSPDPSPKYALWCAVTAPRYPSCWHTISTSLELQ